MKPSPAISRRESSPDESLGDLRFRALLSDAEWAALPLSVRRRFSRRRANGKAVVYIGEILETRISHVGWLLVQAGRLIGAPFPLCRDAHVPSVVSVTEDAATGGQHWTMLYARRRRGRSRFPQIVHSLKHFTGPTGLEDRVRGGVGVTLVMGVKDEALIFRSRDYFIDVLGMRFWLPGWLTPGALTVTHAECADDRFSCMLEVVHPGFGLLIRQMGLVREASV